MLLAPIRRLLLPAARLLALEPQLRQQIPFHRLVVYHPFLIRNCQLSRSSGVQHHARSCGHSTASSSSSTPRGAGPPRSYKRASSSCQPLPASEPAAIYATVSKRRLTISSGRPS